MCVFAQRTGHAARLEWLNMRSRRALASTWTALQRGTLVRTLDHSGDATRILRAKGKRFALPNSRIMIHQPLGGFQGQASDIKIHAEEILKLREKLNEILAHHTGQPVERIAADTDRDFFMGGAEAKSYGIVDDIVKRKV